MPLDSLYVKGKGKSDRTTLTSQLRLHIWLAYPHVPVCWDLAFKAVQMIWWRMWETAKTTLVTVLQAPVLCASRTDWVSVQSYNQEKHWWLCSSCNCSTVTIPVLLLCVEGANYSKLPRGTEEPVLLFYCSMVQSSQAFHVLRRWRFCKSAE